MIMHMAYFLLNQWLEVDFLRYVDDWQEEVRSTVRPASEKRKMTLSDETIEGLRITGENHLHFI